jgi:hypothetical protein
VEAGLSTDPIYHKYKGDDVGFLVQQVLTFNKGSAIATQLPKDGPSMVPIKLLDPRVIVSVPAPHPDIYISRHGQQFSKTRLSVCFNLRFEIPPTAPSGPYAITVLIYFNSRESPVRFTKYYLVVKGRC